MRSRILYIEDKDGGVTGPARIGRVAFSKTGRTVYYRGRLYESLKGSGYKANHFDVETGARCWISGCRRDGADSLNPQLFEIDNDVREEYWTSIRGRPECAALSSFRSPGKHTKSGPARA